MADAINFITSTTINGDVPGGGAWDLYKILNNELINAAATVDSLMDASTPGLEILQFQNFALYVVLTGTTPSVNFQMLQSYNNVAANFAQVGSTVITVTEAMRRVLISAG